MPKDFAEKIIDQPYDLGLRRGASASSSVASGSVGGGGAPSPHALSGEHHSGLLDWDDLSKTGSDLADLATRAHGSLTGVTANQHHNQAHVLATAAGLGADHSISGATVGHVLRASSATEAAFAQLQHGDLGGVTANQHHNQQHAITGSDHTVTGSALDLIGLSGTDTLGVLTPSSNPGAAAKILRTASDGSLQIDTNLLYAAAANNRVGINKTPSGAALDVVVTTNADHTQRLKQKSGQTGRLWRVEDTGGNELIVMDSQGNLQSGNPGFTSGLTGWQITPAGNAEFNNIWARGELHATVFVKDEVHISGGTLLVTTGAVLYNDADIDATTVDTEGLQFEQGSGLEDWEIEQGAGAVSLEVEAVFNFLDIEDSPTGPGFYFDPGETVRSKTEIDTGVTDFWFTIVNGVQHDGYQRYSIIKRSGTDGTLPAGAGIASYKQEGDGLILLTSDLNYAPYMDVFTVGPNVWTGGAGAIVPHVRVGRLDGVGVTAVSGIEQYGIIAGTDLSDTNSPYAVFSNLQLGLYRVDLTLNDGTNDTGEWTAEGNLTIGTNIGTTNGKSFQVITTGSDAGDVIIGRLAGNYLKWDQSAATLTVNGTLQVGGSAAATQTYADSVASTAQSNANAYTDVVTSNLAIDIGDAQAAAESYGNARRVIGVSGTWTSTDADTITWTSVSVRFGNSSTKTVTNGNTGNMGARTYLYVDATASAPLTLSTTTSLASLADTDALIAVADPGADKASVAIVAGSTYISGDNIATGSILAANIKAGAITAGLIAANAVTADKINVSTLSAVQTNTGSLSVTGSFTVGTSGALHTSGKSAYNDDNPGFYLGYASSQYVFGIGDDDRYIRYNGTTLNIKLDNALDIKTPANDNLISFDDGTYSGVIDHTGGELISSANWQFPTVLAEKFDMTDDTFRIRTSRNIPVSASTGLTGEIAWNVSYLYVCVSPNVWRRVALSAY